MIVSMHAILSILVELGARGGSISCLVLVYWLYVNVILYIKYEC